MAAVNFPNAVVDTCIPGVLMSISIPIGDIDACRGTNSVVDINFKSLFKRLNGKSLKAVTSESQKIEAAASSSSSEKDASTSMIDASPSVSSPVTTSKTKNKRSDNIIDKLVRKYCCRDSVLSDDENNGSESSSDSGSDSEVDSTSEAEKTGSASDSGITSSGPKGKKNKAAYVDDYYDMDDPFIDDSEIVVEIESKLKSRRVKTKKDGFFVSVGKLQVEEIPVDEDSNLGFGGSDDFRRRGGRDGGGSRSRWRPAEEVTQHLSQLKEWFINSKIKLFKSSQIPYTLEEPLQKLNVVALRNHPTALEVNPSAYVEAVHDVLGGEIALGKVRGALVRLAAKEKAAEKKAVLNQMIAKLCNDLKPLVIPCPESMQPAFKAKQAAAAAKAGPTPTLGEDGVPVEHQMSQDDMIDVPVSQSADGKPAAEPVHYTWYCKWNIPTRSLLLSVLQTTSEWVKLENVYREKLTVHNMRMLTEEECEFLEEKDELSSVYQRIANFLPTSCYYGDVSGIRKAVSHEKNRLRNLQKKEQKHTEDGVHPASTGDGSTSLPNSPVKRSIVADDASESNKRARVSTDGSELFPLSQSDTLTGGVTTTTSASSSEKARRPRTPKPKAVWEVTPDIQNGLDQFRIIFQATGIKLSKSAHIPHSLESPLHLLNTIVLAVNPDALHITGYVEAVHEVLGGEIPAGRVKGVLLRLVAKEKASEKKAELNGMIDKLCKDLRPLVVPCPDSMQPANKAKAAAAAAAATNASTNDHSMDVNETSRMSFDGVTHCDSGFNDGHDATAVVPSSPSATAEYVHYQWYCKWNVPTRSQLMSVVQCTCDWVKLENSHREKLTSHSIRVMTENEYCILEEKDEITSVFQRIASSFPESCLNGDVASIRRAVASEKGRLKKIQQKEQKAVEAGATAWVSSGAASASASGSGYKLPLSSSSTAKKPSDNGTSNGGSGSTSSSSSSGAARSATAPSDMTSSSIHNSPVKKSLQELTKAAKTPVVPVVTETPKILIANPQKMEINGRVYAAKMLFIPGVSEPAGKKENTVASNRSESTSMVRISSDESVSDSYWDKTELKALESAEADLGSVHKNNSKSSKSRSSANGTSATVTAGGGGVSSLPVDQSTESFMMKYLL